MFKLPKLYLQESLTFQQLFAGIQKTEFTGNGTSWKPYSCQGVKQEQFASLLRVLTTTTKNYVDKVTTQEWKDVFELASRWRMEKTVNIAVHHLSSMELDPIMKLEFAKKHNIQDKEWRFSAILKLVKDDTRLTEGQADLIGHDVALKIARIQGMVHVQGKQPFGNDDDWKLFMERLAEKGIIKDKRKLATALRFPAPPRLLPMLGYRIVRATFALIFCIAFLLFMP